MRGTTLVLGFRTDGLVSAFHRGTAAENVADAVRRIMRVEVSVEAVTGEDPGPGGGGTGSSGPGGAAPGGGGPAAGGPGASGRGAGGPGRSDPGDTREREPGPGGDDWTRDRKSTRLNSSHVAISYAVLCLKKKREQPGERRLARDGDG